MRVSLFATCLGNALEAEAVADAVRVLRSLGVEVSVPAGQACCGQPAHNAGYAREAARMARHTAEVLSGPDAAAVVIPSGSCAAMLRHAYPTIVPGESLPPVWELTEFIVEALGVTRLGPGLAGRRIALHPGCHALRQLGIREQPRTLLREAGAEVVDWAAAEECCGFGGTFSAKFAPVSVAMADRKLDTLPAVDILTSADPGCLMQLGARAAARGHGPPVRHIASLLWEAVGKSESAEGPVVNH